MPTPSASTSVLKAKATRACTVITSRNRVLVIEKSLTWKVAPMHTAMYQNSR